MARTWILLGMMGVGKSAVGRSLAAVSGREFLDTDSLVQQRFGRTITQIFTAYGESTFRDHETSILRSLQPGASVLSTGGGIVLREGNWQEMQRLGTSLYLDASAETLIEHLGKNTRKRPLLHGEGWEDRVRAILESRVNLYRRADVVLNVDTLGVEEVAKCALDAFSGFEHDH